MNMLCRLGVLAFSLLALWFASAGSLAAQEDVAAQVLARINQARAAAGLPALARSAQLDAAAQAHADDLRKNGVSLGHRGSDGSTIKQRLERAGYGGAVTGENWAAYRTLDQIMDFWLNDPPHRQNILRAKFREIGIGVAARANGGLIVITDFGAPANAPEMAVAAPVAAPTKKPRQKPRAAPTQTVAPKPTAAPTRKPTRKPTVAPTVAPQAAPTRVALAPASQAAPASASIALRAGGRVAKSFARGAASSRAGILIDADAPLRRMLGAGLAAGGALGLGIAWLGRRRARVRF